MNAWEKSARHFPQKKKERPEENKLRSSKVKKTVGEKNGGKYCKDVPGKTLSRRREKEVSAREGGRREKREYGVTKGFTRRRKPQRSPCLRQRGDNGTGESLDRLLKIEPKHRWPETVKEGKGKLKRGGKKYPPNRTVYKSGGRKNKSSPEQWEGRGGGK